MDWQRRFGGIARLYGPQALDHFSKAHLCVIGVGGVGSWAVEALARSGVGRLTLIDMDHVAESNVNRQLPALSSTLGRAKIEVLRERLLDINPRIKVHLVDDFVTRDNAGQLLSDDFHGVLDCIDNFRVKAEMIALCRTRALPVVTAGGAGGKQDPGRIRVTDLRHTEQDSLLARTRRQLRQQYGYSRDLKRNMGVMAVWSDEPVTQVVACSRSDLNCGGFGACMPVTATFGLQAAATMLQRLAKP